MFRDFELLFGTAGEELSASGALRKQQAGLAPRQVCAPPDDCLGGRDWNKIWGNISENCHDWEYQRGSPQSNDSQMCYSRDLFVPSEISCGSLLQNR